ncbi:hypothetical protein K469DRAFT_606249 [Zopfia rhizophila CBS 207.26]|uniref:Uncharacterized protein n=1 Tax=Zopfia rhizophila CBS 207.26 TaxID=1314779 RepID=A0A6A6DE71_9PEZI|nr:hypothetical protein K469DRAFT_606249 [Zopfia rhizophila CBS 207.26]
MRVLASVLSLNIADPQPRDGGAPNPSRMFCSSALFLSLAGDESQPRDGG